MMDESMENKARATSGNCATLKRRSFRGQYFSFDAIAASIIFIIAVSILSSYWFGINSVMDSQTDRMNIEAMRLSDTLMTTGYPQNWNMNIGGANQLGLLKTQASNEFDAAKIIKMRDYSFDPADYGKLKGLFKIGGYEFYGQIRKNGTSAPLYSFGKDFSATSPTNIASMQRIGVLDGEFVYLRVFLWTNSSVG
ncbi:hypothetical protein FJZ26_04415 [Candidatus Parvarchaeota archaeon]|nr:hypothetical protein [Candidatus Parvarchaeota archaeon]